MEKRKAESLLPLPWRLLYFIAYKGYSIISPALWTRAAPSMFLHALVSRSRPHYSYIALISCSPQCEQYLSLPRRLLACSSAVQFLAGMFPLNPLPHITQKHTVATERLWFKLVQLVLCILIFFSSRSHCLDLSSLFIKDNGGNHKIRVSNHY